MTTASLRWVTLLFCLSALACGDKDSADDSHRDSFADCDADTDADSDIDSEADSDSDADGDTDADGDADADTDADVDHLGTWDGVFELHVLEGGITDETFSGDTFTGDRIQVRAQQGELLMEVDGSLSATRR